jgi:hypothetical protein
MQLLRIASLLLLVVGLGGCATTWEPVAPAPGPASAFSHKLMDGVQQRFVDERGRVDYPSLAQDRGDLDRYYAALAAVSPDSHPIRFPLETDQLAYWINAYNAAVLVLVLEHYPIDSVEDVRRPAGAFFFPRLSGFFFFQRVRLGGKTTNLYTLENKLIRKRFGEPRIHFAISCASIGCPLLPQHAFRARDLDAALDRAARRFFAQPDKLRIDHAARRVEISSILKWFRDDFLDEETPELADYVRRYLPPERQAELDRARDYELGFLEYDWGLNGQPATP